jgi:hypothetical protein
MKRRDEKETKMIDIENVGIKIKPKMYNFIAFGSRGKEIWTGTRDEIQDNGINLVSNKGQYMEHELRVSFAEMLDDSKPVYYIPSLYPTRILTIKEIK